MILARIILGYSLLFKLFRELEKRKEMSTASSRIVENEIFLNVSLLVNELLRKDEDFQEAFYSVPMYTYIECSICEGEGEVEDEDGDLIECENCEGRGEVEDVPNEPLCFYAVSNWLSEKLQEQGEFILEYAGLNIWGRTTFGQSITLDYVINKITREF